MNEEEIQRYVDEYAGLTAQAERIKERIEELKGYFENLAAGDLADTKLKTAGYWGSRNSRVVVSSSAAVKALCPAKLHALLGNIADDYVKREISWKLTERCKQLLAIAVQGEYLQGSIENTVREISPDPKIQSTLCKRLKGVYGKDKDALMKVAGLSEKEAGEIAYLTTEIFNWERLSQVLRAAGWAGSIQDAVKTIKASAIVEEGVKVSLETGKAK